MAANPEVESFQRYLLSSLDRIVATLDGLTAEQLNWCPPAPEANGVYVLATHMLANVRDNILTVLCEVRESDRDRDAEFAVTVESPATLETHWRELRAEVVAALNALPPGDLDRARSHRTRENVNGRDILLITARHAAEHLDHAEMTRDLTRAIGPG